MRRMHHVAYKEIDLCYWFKEDFRRPLVTFSSPSPTSFSRHRQNFSKRATFSNNLWSQFFCELCQHFCRQITTPPLSSQYMMIKADHNIKGIFLIGYEQDSSKYEADYHAKMLTSTAWLMTILEVKHTTVGIVATCSRRGPDLEPSITAEIAYYTHGSLITQNCQWKYLLRSTASKIPIRHHH